MSARSASHSKLTGKAVANRAKTTSRNLVAIAGLALASLSHAVNLNNDSTGQVLLYPYYTVNAGNQTLISILNFSTLGKAVKVRVLEGQNARSVLSFNLYLAPEDVWTGAIFDTDDVGPGALISLDRSCTAPELSQSPERLNGLPFTSFTSANYTRPTDGGPTYLERTREGSIEVFEMGTILPDTELANLSTHIDGTASGCGQIAQRWASYFGFFEEPFNADMGSPSGGLIGTGAIVDVANGSYIDYRAQTLDGFNRTRLHTEPGSHQPSLANADPHSIVLQDGNAIESNWSHGVDAVSSVLMAEQLHNEFTAETALDGKTEWVVSFPTKAFYVDPARTGSTTPSPPFVERLDKGASCEYALFIARDREAGRPTQISEVAQLPPPKFCFSINVLTLNQTVFVTADLRSSPTRVFGSNLARTVNPRIGSVAVRSGWLSIDFSQYVVDRVSRLRQLSASIEGHRFIGLPAIGFAASQLENRQAAPGLRATYGGAYVHKRKVSCVENVSNLTTTGDCFE